MSRSGRAWTGHSVSWHHAPANALALVLVLVLMGMFAGPATPPGAAPAEVRPGAAPEEVHGANAVFVGRGVAIAWAILRGASEEDTRVVMRVVPRGGPWRRVSVDAVDPFTGDRRVLLAPQPFLGSLDVVTARATFAALTRREVQLYTPDEQHAITIYYLGLPDTTPEFTSAAAVSAYLDRALTEVGGKP
jgi:hypothetical protein